LPDDPNSPAFWAAIERAQAIPAVTTEGGIARMVRAYQDSPKYAGLAESTRRDYDRYLHAMVNLWGNRDPHEVEPYHVAALRDSFGDTPSKADHYVAVIRTVYAWGLERGFAKLNPADSISTIARVEPYEPWPQWAWELVPLMRRELRIACFLGLYTGQRLGDVLRMQLGHVEDGRVRVRQSKTRKELLIKLHGSLRPILDECRDNATIFLVSRQDGSPYTVDQFHAMWGREKKRTALSRLRDHRPPIVFHGLRKSATCKLLEAGCSAKEVGAVTGMSLAMVEHYSRAVEQLRLGDSAMGQWEKEA
jgi:integrase